MSRLKSERRSSSNHPAGAPAGAIAPWLLLALAVPRIARMLYPQLWVEDDFYLESAWLVARGMRPYLDFVHPHLPLLEWIAAIYLKVFGASHRSMEFLNETALYAASILTFKLGQRIATRGAAQAGAIAFACASLVFRYHAYERECFVAPLLAFGALVALDESKAPRRQAATLGVLIFAACAIKLTSIIPFGVILIWIAIARGQLRIAIGAGAIGLATLAVFSDFLYLRYGFDFVFQVFIFHFLKGRTPRTIAIRYPRLILDWLVPMFAVGAAAMISRGEGLRRSGLVLAIAAAEYAFYGFLSPTSWPHNYLEPLPFIAIVAGIGIARIGEAAGNLFSNRGGGREIAWLGGGVALTIVSLATVAPLVNENWLHGAVYGFGFVDRDEIEQLGDEIRAHSRPDDLVIAPAFAAFEANRAMLVRYPETYGVARNALDALRSEGFIRARAALGSADFFELIARTADYWTAEMRAAIGDGRARVVVNDSALQMLPLVAIPSEELDAHGYRPVTRTEHYIVWARPLAPAAN